MFQIYLRTLPNAFHERFMIDKRFENGIISFYVASLSVGLHR